MESQLSKQGPRCAKQGPRCHEIDILWLMQQPFYEIYLLLAEWRSSLHKYNLPVCPYVSFYFIHSLTTSKHYQLTEGR